MIRVFDTSKLDAHAFEKQQREEYGTICPDCGNESEHANPTFTEKFTGMLFNKKVQRKENYVCNRCYAHWSSPWYDCN